MPVRVFPVDLAGRPKFRDEPVTSHGGKHDGTDIFASKGTRVLAVDDGHVSYGVNELGGNVARLIVEDGTTYYYAHLMASPLATTARDVKAGDVIGFVGNTGNARGAEPHLHFGIYPPGKGVPPIDPFAALASAAERSSAVSTQSSSSSVVSTFPKLPGWAWALILWQLSKRRT